MTESKVRNFVHKDNLLSYDDLDAVTTENGRRYTTPDGKLYPSVTTVLGILSEDSIRKWKEKIGYEEAAKISRAASIRGEKVHEACEDYLNNVPWEDIKWKYKSNILASLLWMRPHFNEHIGEIYCLEVPLYSDELKLAGRVDCIAEWDGEIAIIDFKTSMKAKKESYIENYYCQETAYALMWEEQTGIPIKKLVTIIACDAMTWGGSAGCQIFITDRDKWTPKLHETIKLYEARL